MSVSGISKDTTPAEIDALLDGPAKIAYEALKKRFAGRVADLKARKS